MEELVNVILKDASIHDKMYPTMQRLSRKNVNKADAILIVDILEIVAHN